MNYPEPLTNERLARIEHTAKTVQDEGAAPAVTETVLILCREVRRLRTMPDNLKPEALEAEIQAVKDEHAAIMKRLEDGAVGALDRLLTAAKAVRPETRTPALVELEAAIAAADALTDEMDEAVDLDAETEQVERMERELKPE